MTAATCHDEDDDDRRQFADTVKALELARDIEALKKFGVGVVPHSGPDRTRGGGAGDRFQR